MLRFDPDTVVDLYKRHGLTPVTKGSTHCCILGAMILDSGPDVRGTHSDTANATRLLIDRGYEAQYIYDLWHGFDYCKGGSVGRDDGVAARVKLLEAGYVL